MGKNTKQIIIINYTNCISNRREIGWKEKEKRIADFNRSCSGEKIRLHMIRAAGIFCHWPYRHDFLLWDRRQRTNSIGGTETAVDAVFLFAKRGPVSDGKQGRALIRGHAERGFAGNSAVVKSAGFASHLYANSFGCLLALLEWRCYNKLQLLWSCSVWMACSRGHHNGFEAGWRQNTPYFGIELAFSPVNPWERWEVPFCV